MKSGETVVNMFSGVGCFSIIIAKTVPQTKVYSIDVNPTASTVHARRTLESTVFTAKSFPCLATQKTSFKLNCKAWLTAF